jgi:hypothetical protein
LEDFIKGAKDGTPVAFRRDDMTMGVIFYKDSAIINSFGSVSDPNSRDFSKVCGPVGGFIMDEKIYKIIKP